MALDAYIQIKDIPGEALDEEHKDWIQVQEIQHAMHQKASPSQDDVGGITAAKAEHEPVRIRKAIDKASPVLAEKCSSGEHIPTVTIEMLRASGKSRVKFIKIELAEAIVSDIAVAGQANGEAVPSEWISLRYGKIKWTYMSHGRDGNPGATTPGGWDLTKNKKWG